MSTVIKSKTCYLRQLGVNDDLASYLYWMQTPSNNPYILSADSSYDLTQLKEFIKICNNRSDALLLGIFTNENSLHIGNIKFEKIIDDNAHFLVHNCVIPCQSLFDFAPNGSLVQI